ncbi:segregation and condensation protein A [Bauldia litoralis]|uniref:Segregation and condensation protein A n=2 Tax=Bauldia litoralis TaxID=665467 RepID=A0A1G6ATW9_9HYPH|nr:ScpA family protein [Bauldia litoralis]SDB11788.1 condensin subunit ScpA [Bauldia litoralis]
MSTASQDQNEIWETFKPLDQDNGEPSLVVDVDGFEGPLDLLLALARSQKVDITRISILALAEQYLTFIEEVRKLRLELAADYLVMAAWLAYLKSRLLLPEAETDEPTGEELAAELAFRLQRLEAMRDAAARLANRDRLGRDVFGRGDPEPVEIVKKSEYSATLYDLLSAYAARRQERSISVVHVRRRTVWSLKEARDLLGTVIGKLADWAPMHVFLSPYLTAEVSVTVTASAFGASLELVREGQIDLRQTEAFAPLYIRDHKVVEAVTPEADHG